MAAAAATAGAWVHAGTAAAATTTLVSDSFSNGTAGSSVAGNKPSTTDAAGGVYALNGATAFGATYGSVGGSPAAAVGADDGLALPTGLTAPSVYNVSINFNSNNSTQEASGGPAQRGEGLGFFSNTSNGANDFHGVDSFTGVLVSTTGLVSLVTVAPQGTDAPGGGEPLVTVVSSVNESANYASGVLDTLSYTANTSTGLISNVLLNGVAVPLTDTTPLFTPTATADVGFTNSTNGGGQTALFNGFVVTDTTIAAVPEPGSFGVIALATGGMVVRRRRRTV